MAIGRKEQCRGLSRKYHSTNRTDPCGELIFSTRSLPWRLTRWVFQLWRGCCFSKVTGPALARMVGMSKLNNYLLKLQRYQERYLETSTCSLLGVKLKQHSHGYLKESMPTVKRFVIPPQDTARSARESTPGDYIDTVWLGDGTAWSGEACESGRDLSTGN